VNPLSATDETPILPLLGGRIGEARKPGQRGCELATIGKDKEDPILHNRHLDGVASTLWPEMGIPRLHKNYAMLDHENAELVKFVQAEPAGLRNADWVQPELRDVVTLFYIDMRRLGTFLAVEEEPKAQEPNDGRHR
jgi:hypothetical protein